ncbi:MAG: NUDIX domain-containing protein [Patescibacteria group bacterium]
MLQSYIAVKALIKNKDSFLILKTTDSDQNNNLSGWETPGGRLEVGEDIVNGLKREIKEETGLSVKILFPFNAFSANVGQEDSIVGINYLAEYSGGEIRIDTNEHSSYQWINISNIKKLKDSIGLQKEIDAYEGFIDKYKEL